MILRFCNHVDLCHLSICSEGAAELVESFYYVRGAGLLPNLLVLDNLDPFQNLSIWHESAEASIY